ncbi:unnamed protein product, partial [Oppiella nova]
MYSPSTDIITDLDTKDIPLDYRTWTVLLYHTIRIQDQLKKILKEEEAPLILVMYQVVVKLQWLLEKRGDISVDSTNGNAPAYNLGNVSGGQINVRSGVPHGFGCCCEIVSDESDDYFNNLEVKPREGNIRKSEKEIYDMSKPNQRGLCIIFNIVKFPGHETRDGSSYEARCLQKVHTQLSCEVDVINSDEEQNDCKYQDIINKLEQTSKLPNNTCYNALFVFFLSHGESNGLCCSDGEILPFNKPADMFNDNSSTWKEIPKFFSYHCCRGTEFDYQTTDTSRSTSYAHTLINFSTQSVLNALIGLLFILGYVSWRHTQYGTYFGKAYCLSACEHAHDKHLQQILEEILQP